MLEILLFLPPIHSRTPPAAVGSTPSGSGILLITSCAPGGAVQIQPGTISGAANAEGVVILKAPAQRRGADPYEIRTPNAAGEFNGTLDANALLSASCP
jgi:hypothetical protein